MFLYTFIFLAYLNSNKIQILVIVISKSLNIIIRLMSQNMCSIIYYGLYIPQVIITEEYPVQFCKLSYFLLVFLNSNYHNKEIKIH